jgi:hypothetical protein
MLLRVIRVLAVGAVSALLAGGAGAAAELESFRTPSRDIGCLFAPRGDLGPGLLRCDVLGGLRPEPGRACTGDWSGATVGLAGRAAPACAGDTAYDPRARVLAHGRTWRRAGIAGVSRRAGLTCRNRGGHGFFLSRRGWRVF